MNKFEMRRVTAAYFEEEDRLRLLGVDDSGGLAELWMTRRLAENLIRHLDGVVPEPPEKAEQVDRVTEQREEATPAVTKTVDAVPGIQFLVTSVDISEIQHLLNFVFHGRPDPRPVEFALEKEALHSWVRELKQLVQNNGWLHDSGVRQDSEVGSPPRAQSTTLH